MTPRQDSLRALPAATNGEHAPFAYGLKKGIYESEGIDLTTVGFGMGNFNDVLLEQLANRGNGFYAYVNDRADAERLFGERLTSALQLAAQRQFAKTEVVHFGAGDENTVRGVNLMRVRDGQIVEALGYAKVPADRPISLPTSSEE